MAAVAGRALHAFADALGAGCGDADPPEQQLAAQAARATLAIVQGRAALVPKEN